MNYLFRQKLEKYLADKSLEQELGDFFAPPIWRFIWKLGVAMPPPAFQSLTFLKIFNALIYLPVILISLPFINYISEVYEGDFKWLSLSLILAILLPQAHLQYKHLMAFQRKRIQLKISDWNGY